MSKFTDNASEKLLVVAGKISNQKHMASIKNAFYTLMPVILTGAFCTLISNVVCSTTTTGISLAKLPGMSWLGMFTDLFNAANYATLNFFTVAAVFLDRIPPTTLFSLSIWQTSLRARPFLQLHVIGIPTIRQ